MMYRVEDKYCLPWQDYYALKERIASVLEPDPNAGPEGQYTISSLYFDDVQDADYHETVAGNPIRRKHRIRIYNNSFSSIKLEVKTKKYQRISKVSSEITLEDMRGLMRGDRIDWGTYADDARSLFNLGIAARHLTPRVIITYERSAYLYEPGNTRITFDRNVRASADVERFGDSDIVYDPLEEDYVLEVKYDEFIPDFLLQILESNVMQQISYSKYARCREIYR